jgi:hypothetical protein
MVKRQISTLITVSAISLAGTASFMAQDARANWDVNPHGTWMAHAPTARGTATTGIDTLGLVCRPDGQPLFYLIVAGQEPQTLPEQATLEIDVDGDMFGLRAARVQGETTFYGEPTQEIVRAMRDGQGMTIAIAGRELDFTLSGASAPIKEALEPCMPVLR